MNTRGYTNGLMAPELPGQPAPTLVTLHPVGMPQQDDQQQASLRVKALLSAFRRRWVVAIFLGLLASSAAAAGVWYAIPDSYTAFCELLVEPNERFLYSDSETRESTIPLNVYKQSGMRQATFPFVLTAALREDGIAQLPTIKNQIDPIRWLEENLEVTSPATQFIRISLTSPHQNDVAPIVNAVVEAFQREVVDSERNQKTDETQSLEDHLRGKQAELQRLRGELSRTDKLLNAANEEHINVKMEAQFAVQVQLRQQLGQVEWEILQSKIELEALRDRVASDMAEREREKAEEAATETASGPDAEMVLPDFELPEGAEAVVENLLLADPGYVELARSLNEQELQLKVSEKRYRPGHRKIIECRDEIARLKREMDEFRKAQTPVIREQLIAQVRLKMKEQLAEQEIKESIAAAVDPGNTAPAPDPVATAQRQLDLLIAKRDALLGEIVTTKNATDDLSNTWVDRELLQEDVDKLKQEVSELDKVVRYRKVEAQHSTTPVKVRRPAETPKLPDQGKRIKLAGAAGLGLFALVVAGVVLLEYSAHRLNSVSEVQADLNLPVMSTIPLMPRWVNSDSGNSRNRRSEYWHSVLTESVDATRTMLLRQAHINSTKVVMIASATGGEGKTTLSCHLATSLARSGRDVLLIDGDIRRPSVHKVFDLKNKPGFCEVLTGNVELPDALHEASPAGLTVLTAGRVDADALRVLSQDKLGQLLDVARSQFDFIILDTSPILPVTDALLMAQFADGVLFSLRRDVSRAAKVSAAVQRVSMLGVNILGAVAIGLDEGQAKSQHSYYNYGYGYGYGYGQNPHAPAPAPAGNHR